jgi:hypothetical protein
MGLLVCRASLRKVYVLLQVKGIPSFSPAISVDNTRKESDPWYEFSAAIDEFNEIHQLEVTYSRWISLDETMSA